MTNKRYVWGHVEQHGTRSWEIVVFNSNAAYIFIVPLNDIVLHEESSINCVCGPKLDVLEHPNGDVTHLITHISLDGRERPKIG
jgi:hypothetical protein